MAISCQNEDGKDIAYGSGFLIPAGLVASADEMTAMLKENTYTMRGFSQFAYVLTNYHVIEAAASVRVKFVAGDSCTPFFIYEDEERDLALLVVASPTVKPVLTLSRRKPTMGSRVFAIGCPEGFDFTISDGLLSGRRKESGNEWLQTSAPVSNGSSGGPLIDIFGEVIGVATLSHRFGQNLNFAIPVENVMHFLKVSVQWNP